MDILKRCVKCLKEKPLGGFRNQAKTKDGKKCYCIECDDAYNKENYLKNKDKRIALAKKWQKDNFQKSKEYKSNWSRKTNPLYQKIDNATIENNN